jgi:8-oxo-dGTP diphosphatase
MTRQFRISAGAVVLLEDKVLLVRYNDSRGKSFLVGPGGGVFLNEATDHAIVREVLEETGLEVSPLKILLVEDMLSKRHRITKIWFLCRLLGGKLEKTDDAVREGITGVGWYSKDRLKNEKVYPVGLLDYDWEAFYKDSWQTVYLGLQNTDF